MTRNEPKKKKKKKTQKKNKKNTTIKQIIRNSLRQPKTILKPIYNNAERSTATKSTKQSRRGVRFTPLLDYIHVCIRG